VRTVADDNGVEHKVALKSHDTFASVDVLATTWLRRCWPTC